MGVVSVRLDDETQAWIEKRGLKAGTFARQAVMEAIRLEELRANIEWLDTHRVDFGGDSTKLIREDRDEHARAH